MNNAGWRDILEAATQKDFQAVKYFVEKRNASIKTCDANDRTIAHIAVENDQFFMFKYCLSKDPSVTACKDNKMRSVLVQAVQKNAFSMVVYLLEHCKEDILKDYNLFYGLTIVHVAAQHGHLELLKYLFEEFYIDCDIKNDVGETPLFFAAENVHMPVVRYLVEDQAVNVFVTDDNDDHVLYVSAWRGDVIVPRYLLDERQKRIDLNSRDRSGETLLHRAVQFNHLGFAEYLIDEKHVNVNVADNEGRTPLYHAVAQGNYTIAKYLCEKGAHADKTVLELKTDKRITRYLEEIASNRSRRSVSSTFDRRTMLPALESVCANPITGSIASLRSDGDRPPFPDSFFSLVNGVLMFASLCQKYSSVISGEQKSVPSSLPFTPTQILKNRMDPVAVEAIETMSDFEKPRTVVER